jgi:hypothetical protein
MAKKTDPEKELLRKAREICAYSLRTGDHDPVRKMAAFLDNLQRVIQGARKELEQAALKQRAITPPVKTSHSTT